MAEYNFEKFLAIGEKTDDRVSLLKNYIFWLSRAFCKKNNIIDKKNVVLFYDQARHTVGMFFSNTPKKGSFKINYDEKKGSAFFTAISFLKTYNIFPEVYSGKYPWEKNNYKGQELIIFPLSKRQEP